MAVTDDLDYLLQPVLGSEDDAALLGRPWRPWSLAMLAVFAGSLAAGPLAAWNFRWLGMSRYTLPVLALVLIWWLGGIWVGFELYGREQIEHLVAERNAQTEPQRAAAAESAAPGADPATPAWMEQRRRWRLPLRLVDLAPILVIAALQRRRFRVFEGTGGEPRSLWIPGVCALAGVLLVSIAVLPALWVLFGSI